jgi:hypothetical protein
MVRRIALPVVLPDVEPPVNMIIDNMLDALRHGPNNAPPLAHRPPPPPPVLARPLRPQPPLLPQRIPMDDAAIDLAINALQVLNALPVAQRALVPIAQPVPPALALAGQLGAPDYNALLATVNSMAA